MEQLGVSSDSVFLLLPAAPETFSAELDVLLDSTVDSGVNGDVTIDVLCIGSIVVSYVSLVTKVSGVEGDATELSDLSIWIKEASDNSTKVGAVLEYQALHSSKNSISMI